MKTYFKVSEDQLARMYDAGMSGEEIAKVYGCNRRTVYDWFKRFGFKPRIKVKCIGDDAVTSAIERARLA